MEKKSKGGLTKGPSHAKGGIKMQVGADGTQIEVEGGEGIINNVVMDSIVTHDFEGKKMTACQIASFLNQTDGNGVKFSCDVNDNPSLSEGIDREMEEAISKRNKGGEIKLDGGEGIINKYVMASKKKYSFNGKKMTPCDILSELNQSRSEGRKFNCSETENTDMTPTDPSTGFAEGGEAKKKTRRGEYAKLASKIKKDEGITYREAQKKASAIFKNMKAKGGVAGDIKKEVKKIATPKALTTDIAEEVAEAALFDKGGEAEKVEYKVEEKKGDDFLKVELNVGKGDLSNIADITASLLSRGILNEGGKLAKGSVVFPKEFMEYVKSDNVIQRSNGLYYNNETQYRKGFTLKELYKWTQKEDYGFAKGGSTGRQGIRDSKEDDVKRFMKNFPSNATSWRDATDELRTMANSAREYYIALDLDGDKSKSPKFFTSIKQTTPSEFNKGHKKNVVTYMKKMSDETFDAFYKEFKETFRSQENTSSFKYAKGGYIAIYENDGETEYSFELADRSFEKTFKSLESARKYAKSKGYKVLDVTEFKSGTAYAKGGRTAREVESELLILQEQYMDKYDTEKQKASKEAKLLNSRIAKLEEEYRNAYAKGGKTKKFPKGGYIDVEVPKGNFRIYRSYGLDDKQKHPKRDYYRSDDFNSMYYIEDGYLYEEVVDENGNLRSKSFRPSKTTLKYGKYAKGGVFGQSKKDFSKEQLEIIEDGMDCLQINEEFTTEEDYSNQNEVRNLAFDKIMAKGIKRDAEDIIKESYGDSWGINGWTTDDQRNAARDSLIFEGYSYKESEKLVEKFQKNHGLGYEAYDYAKGGDINPFEKTKQYLGKDLSFIEIYDEDKNPYWDDEAQAMIEYYQRQGKMAMVVHRGNLHALYSEKSSFAKGGETYRQTFGGFSRIDEDEVKKRLYELGYDTPSRGNYYEILVAKDGVRLAKIDIKGNYYLIFPDGKLNYNPYKWQNLDGFINHLISTPGAYAKGGDIKSLPQQLVDADRDDTHGWGSIADTPYIDGDEITIIVHAGDGSVKSYLNKLIKGFGYKTKFEEVSREGNVHYYTWKITKIHAKGGDVDNPNELYFIIRHGNGEALVQISKDYGDSKYSERFIAGDKPYNFGNKTYQSYLSPSEIENYLANDYISARMVDEEEVRNYIEFAKEEANKLIIMKFPEDYVDPGILTIVKGEEAYDFDTNTGKIEFYTKFNSYPDNLNKNDFLEDAYPVGEEDLTESDKKIILDFFKDKLNYGGEVYPNNKFALGGKASSNTYSGKEVAEFVVDITPEDSDVPDYFIEKLIIPNNGWEIKEIQLKELLKDKDFKAYHDSNDERYNVDEVNEQDLYFELVVLNGELLDGYSRASKMLRLGDSTASAFVLDTRKNKDGEPKIECQSCGWTWKVSEGGDDLYICHKCYTDNEPYAKGGETYEKQYKRRVVKTTKKEHKDKGYNWRIKGKDRNEVTIKLYEKKPDFEEFSKQLQRVAGHEFGTRAVGGKVFSSRGRIPSVRGGWTKEKIIRYFKSRGSDVASTPTLAKYISEFDNWEDFKNNIYYHGTSNYFNKGLSPSIIFSERQAETLGGGGYGERYFGISLTKRKRTAEAFSAQSSMVKIYPVILKRDAKVIHREDLQDASEIEDIIVELYESGVDAVWIGGGEQELVVVNPYSIILYRKGVESHTVYGSFKSIPLTDEKIKEIYDSSLRIWEGYSENKKKAINKEERNELLNSIPSIKFKKGGNINWFKSKEGKGDPAITKRNKPNVSALEKYGAGEISYDDYLKISQKETPIKEIDVFYEPATYDEIYNALEKQNQKISTKQGKVPKQNVIDAPIEKGQAIGVRLDIPSYVRYNTWVVSIHDGHKQSGKPISYQAVVRIKDVTFGTVPSFAFLIAIGDVPKNTIGRMYGYYDPIEGETAEERSENTKKLVSEINKDKDWSQVGMNPFRHSYFYLRKNGMPVVSADEVVQIGGLVYAKNAKTVKPDDDEFKIDNSRVKEKYPGITHFNKGGENDINDLAYTIAWDCHIGGNRPNIDVVKKDIKKLMIEENIGMHYLLTNCYDYFEKGGLI